MSNLLHRDTLFLVAALLEDGACEAKVHNDSDDEACNDDDWAPELEPGNTIGIRIKVVDVVKSDGSVRQVHSSTLLIVHRRHDDSVLQVVQDVISTERKLSLAVRAVMADNGLAFSLLDHFGL